MKTIFAAMAACLLPAAGLAQDHAAHEAPAGLSVSDAYVRSSNPKTGAAYMMLQIGGQTACTLAGITTDAADMAEVHTSVEENGVARMVAADPVVLQPGGMQELSPGGDHLMLMGLKAPLKDGDSVALTLDFGDCGTVDLTAPVDNRRKPMGGASAHAH